ncbi:MAG: hypothetical protein Q9174_001601 [Haloplaca sp. 1 TL-2023]
MAAADNRGMGDSDKPLSRYTTSGMAKDVLEIVDYLGWKSSRQLHVIGVSMGGMIAQELVGCSEAWDTRETPILDNHLGTYDTLKNSIAYPGVERSSHCEHDRLLGKPPQPDQHGTIPFPKLEIYLQGFSIPKSPDVQLDDIKGRLFSQTWLEAPDDYGEFPTNGDRFAAMELKKRQDTEGFTRMGFICQAIAAGWHHKSTEQIRDLANQVGRQRIQVLHGTIDQMITVPHGETLARELGEEQGVSKMIIPGRGHVLHMEEYVLYNQSLERMMDKVEKFE